LSFCTQLSEYQKILQNKFDSQRIFKDFQNALILKTKPTLRKEYPRKTFGRLQKQFIPLPVTAISMNHTDATNRQYFLALISVQYVPIREYPKL